MRKRKVASILVPALVIAIALGLVSGAVAQAPEGSVTDLLSQEQLAEAGAAEVPQEAPQKLQAAQLNPDFIDCIENPPEPFYGYLPPPVDLSHLQGVPVKRGGTQIGLPSAFDWRDSGDVTPVKDQNPCGTCWVFGTLSAVESRVLIVDGVEYNFSEQNVACCTDPSWVYLNHNRCMGGGWSWLATDVLTKKGTRLESCDPYNTGTINTEPCNDSCSTIKRVTGYRWITDNPNDIAEVKDAIYNYGPVSMAFYYSDARMYPGSIYYYPGCTADANHLVSIVGWDDSIAHPLGGGSGAWIVKNSWGTGWGDSGYFYLCYGSANMQEVASYRYQDYDPNENLYYWDEAGWVGDIGVGRPTLWMGSVFNSGQDGDLTHVEFWTTSNNAEYELYVYDGSFGTQLAYQAGTCDELGYYSIPLNTPVPLANGQQFSVAVEITTPGYYFPLPAEGCLEDGGVVLADPPIQTGVSFYSEDGRSWDDLGPYGFNACLRARVTTSAGPTPTPTPTPTPGPTPTPTPAPPVLEEISWYNGAGNVSPAEGDELVFKFSEDMDTSTIYSTNIEDRLPTNPDHSYGTLTGDDLDWSNGNKWLTVTIGPGETIEGGETVDPSSYVKSAAGLPDETTSPGPEIPTAPTPTPFIWEFPHGLNNDSTALFPRRYGGVEVVLVDLTPPSELVLVWYYDEAAMTWEWGRPGWPESTLETLENWNIYLIIVESACTWEIPQPS
jgi:C1A family cysteine protease